MGFALLTGTVCKLKSIFLKPVQYVLPIGETSIPLNDYLGKVIVLKFCGQICCLNCHQKIKKSYSQGYCFSCSQKLARCDLCIVRPEKCHYHLGTCREPEWAANHCFIPHIVYLANTSDFKIGITRATQIPTRWIDQGASQALPILRVKNRYRSGLIEVKLKEKVNDKTNWRKMLMSEGENLDLFAKKEQLLNELQLDDDIELMVEKVTELHYPVLEYPTHVTSLNLEKTLQIEGTLLGIKGQYLLLDVGVINIRNLSGYVISVGLR